jgi:MFS family permease
MPAFAAFLTIYLMKRMGRKPLIQLGTVSCGFCQLIMFLSFLFKEDLDTVATILIAIAMVLFMVAFGLTLGPLVWLYIP